MNDNPYNPQPNNNRIHIYIFDRLLGMMMIADRETTQT